MLGLAQSGGGLEPALPLPIWSNTVALSCSGQRACSNFVNLAEVDCLRVAIVQITFLPGWQAVVPNLPAGYVDGYHRELMTATNVRNIAGAITSHLMSTRSDTSSSAVSPLLDRSA